MQTGPWTWLALALALFGPGAIALASHPAPGAEFTVASSAPWLLAFTGLVASVAALARYKDRLRWAVLGFRRTSWISVPLGLAYALFSVFVYGPAITALLAWSGLGSFDAGAGAFAALPAWYWAMTIVVVASGEEWLYRGYAIERLQVLGGSATAAGLLSLLAFTAAHLPLWGFGPAVTVLVSGGIATALYLWRRDIVFLIIGHVLTDLYGLLVVR